MKFGHTMFRNGKDGSVPDSTWLDLDTLKPDVQDITKEPNFRQRQRREGQKHNISSLHDRNDM